MDGLIGEYEKHLGTVIMYPSRNDIWRDNAVHMQKYICDLAETISNYEKVFFYCQEQHVSFLRNKYENNSNICVIPSNYDDIWARDVGPSFVRKGGQISCVDWKFNAWGGMKEGSYYPWDKDDAFAAFVSDCFNLKKTRSSIVVEGGAIISDGAGSIFTTRSVLLNRNRNPFKSKKDVEIELLAQTGARRVVWIDQGLSQDETNGHVDNLLSFVNQREICLAWTDETKDTNYKRLAKVYNQLNGMSNLLGEPYIIHCVPMPPKQIMSDEESTGLIRTEALERNAGDILPASYLNIYIMNGAVLVPAFGCKTDKIAFRIFKRVFSDRDVIQIYSREPLLGGGGIHCILHEVPLVSEVDNEISN